MSRSYCGDFSRSTGRSGLTLLEMVIVLGILAVLTTVAVRSLEPLADQARYEATQRQLENLKLAVADPHVMRQPDGSVSLSGFVADVGRLPVASGAGTMQLAELWDASLWEAYEFQVRSGPTTPEDYSAIGLPCGWRGPYLHPSRPKDGIYDGWGNPFVAVTSGTAILGALWNPLPGYEALQSDWSHALATVSGVLTDAGEPASGTAVLLYPDPPQPTLAVMADSDGAVDNAFIFRDVPVGLRAIRATIGEKTVTRYVQVPPGGLTLAIGVQP